jgi:hypothetical protein
LAFYVTLTDSEMIANPHRIRTLKLVPVSRMPGDKSAKLAKDKSVKQPATLMADQIR